MKLASKDRVGRHIKLRDLHILLAVAERGSLLKAAADLAVSPPVISKAISDLEAEIGVKLFDRGRHGAVPTAYGRALLNRSVSVFDELRQAITEIESLSDPTVGDVRIGGLAAMVAGLLPRVIGELRPKYPRLTVHVTQILTSPSVYDNLRSRAFDLIIGRLPARPLDGDLVSEVLFAEPLAIVAGIHSPFARRRKIDPSELAAEPWILPQPGTEVGSVVGEIFTAHGLQPPAAPVICSSIEMYWGLLATGRFIASMPRSLLKFATQRETVKVLPINLSVKPGPVGVVMLRDRTVNPGVSLFLTQTRAVCSTTLES